MVVDAFVFTAGTRRAITHYSNSNRRTNNDVTFGTPRQDQPSSVTKTIRSSTTTVLHAASPSTSLKPAALYLMDSGKALARSGELLIELTTELDLYGGALSASGAQMRNAGDCLAQAAASLAQELGPAERRYVTGFVRGLARHAHDTALEAAALIGAADQTPGQEALAHLRQMISSRLTQTEVAFGPKAKPA